MRRASKESESEAQVFVRRADQEAQETLDTADVAAAVVFDGVHAGIGGADDGVDGGSVCGRGSQADAGAHGQLESVFHAEARGLQSPMQAGRLLQGGIGGGVRAS